MRFKTQERQIAICLRKHQSQAVRCASKLAAQLKEAVAAFQMPGGRVMSDVTGDFNRVIMEHTAESLEEFEKRMQETMGSPMYRERMAGYTELWITGSREVLRVV